MKRLVAVALLSLVAAGCADNEVSFFVEHMKAMPTPPECVVSASDPVAPGVTFDAAIATSVSTSFLLRNQLVARAQPANLVSEPNGIVIEGSEVYITSADGTPISGGTRYIESNNYLEPESSDIFWAPIVLESDMSAIVASSGGCYDAWDFVEYPLDSDGTPPEPRSLGVKYATVVFLGHTNGGVEVATPEFTVPVEVVCGNIAWTPCADICRSFCTSSDSTALVSCQPGVNSAIVDCRELTSNPFARFNCADAGADPDFEDDAGVGPNDECGCLDCPESN